MTIIAISNTHCAADGMKTWGPEIRGLNHKKLLIRELPNSADRAIFAFTGTTALQIPIIDWYLAGADAHHMPPEAGEWTLLVIDKHGLLRLSSSTPYAESFDAPMAAGTGIDMALGAMYSGRTAREAVEMVCERHTVCGGEIQVLDIAEVTGFTLAKRVPNEDYVTEYPQANGGVILGAEIRRLGLQGS